MKKTAIVDLGYGVALALLSAAMVTGTVLTLYEEGETFTGHVVVGCALYLGALGALLMRRGVRKL